jgi:hypothetical protein
MQAIDFQHDSPLVFRSIDILPMEQGIIAVFTKKGTRYNEDHNKR